MKQTTDSPYSHELEIFFNVACISFGTWGKSKISIAFLQNKISCNILQITDLISLLKKPFSNLS